MSIQELTLIQQSIVVFITQILFLWFRTHNIKAISDDDIFKAMWSGVGIAICWLIGIAIGSYSVIHGNILPLLAHIIGGLIGTYYSIKQNIKKKNKTI